MKMWRYKVLVDMTDSMEVAGFLDMLRYDEAIIRDWSHGNGDTWLVTFACPNGLPATIERWQSFGLRPELVGV